MNDEQLLRYARHLLLDDIGVEGQERLLASSALVVGAGGLGSPAAMYLAAAGVGRITVVDHDAVDLTNLQRQIAHTTDRVGQLKVRSLASTVAALNPGVDLIALDWQLSDAPDQARRVAALVEQADVLLDCTDNFATRALLNRLAVGWRKPLVSGAAIRFEGQVSVYDLRHDTSPCYACLFPESAEDLAPVSCATMGVFSPLVGMVGSVQAAEALKVLTGAGTPLTGRLLRVDALHADWRSVRVRRDPACAVCGGTARGASLR